MVSGSLVGIVEDNRDPDGLHRVKVRFPVAHCARSSWCRLVTPMGGSDRGLVMLPDVGTEVLLAMSHRSMTPYVLGALYNNEEDRAEPYRNDDDNDDKRVYWSRNDHQLVFDDTPGAESVSVGAGASTRLDPQSAPVSHRLDAAAKRLTERCAGITIYEAKRSFSIKCKSLKLEAERVLVKAGSDTVVLAPNVLVKAGEVVRATAPDVLVKMGASAATSPPAWPAQPALHPPTKAA